MTKKGKYKLLSYLIEDFLLFYKSLNRSKRLYAFCIFEVSDFNQIISKLNQFLKAGFFSYCSIQINISNQKIKGILCFKANEKSDIIEHFGLASNKLTEYDNSLKFLKDKDLEDKFLRIIDKANSNIRIYNKSECILFKNHTYEKILESYEILPETYDNTNIFHLMTLIKNLNQKGHFILNFKNIYNNIGLNMYYVRIRDADISNTLNFEDEINNVFNLSLLKKSKNKITDVYRILWRLNLTENFSPFNKIAKFLSIENNSISSLPEFNLKFEELLISNKIDHQKLNQNLYFIEQKIVFMTFIKVDFKLILRIFKRFFSKYQIYLLILDEKEYHNLLKIDKIKLLEGLIILNYKEFMKLDFNAFKESKNT